MKKIFTLLFFVIMIQITMNAQNDTLAMWSFPNNDLADTLPDVHNEANINSFIFTEGASAIAMKNGLTTKAAQATEWQEGAEAKSWQIKISTLAYKTLDLSVKITAGETNPGPRDFKTQYRIGTAGEWTDIEGGELTVYNDWTSGVLDQLPLPEACQNIEELYLRFVMRSNTAQDGSEVLETGTSKVDDLLVSGILYSGLDPISNKENKVYPNPSHGQFYIESQEQIKSIRVYSMTGQLVYTKECFSTKEQINLELPQGSYFVKAEYANKEVKVNRVMLQ